jgi:PA domain-containing protein
MKNTFSKVMFLMLVVLVALTLTASTVRAATIIINNVDDPGKGLNDPTKVKPVGKNNGTTLGAQRLNVFQKAAAIWGNTLDSNVTIVVQATFQDRGFTPCTANSAVLGAAGTIQIFANTPGLLWPNTWYHSALANKLAGADQQPGPLDPGFLQPPFADDIIAFFNPNLGAANCLAGSSWYYGLDNKASSGTIDFLNVVTHEMGHGLGFANFVDVSSGTLESGLPDVYSAYSHDDTNGKQWNQMTDSERLASATNTGKLVWNGPSVVAAAPGILAPLQELKITAPSSLSGTVIDFGTASFGPTPGPSNFSGDVVLANDGIGTTSDGCEPLVNAAEVAGKIALIDRGTCTFVIKTKNAQNAGATGVMIANNVSGAGAFGLGGTDSTIVIPAIGISQESGTLIKQNLPGLHPSSIAGGSSVSHWDTVATPNLLMEPFINSDLKSATTLDLTPNEMTDIGWSGGLHCPVNSDSSATIKVGACETGVINDVGPFTLFPAGSDGRVAAGCTAADLVHSCDGVSTCLAKVTSAMQAAGIITNAEKDAIMACP